MHRVLLALSLLAACDEASGPAEPAPPESTREPVATAEAPEEALEPEAEPEAEPAYYVAERPDAFFLVDDCHRASGATAAEALRECRRLARSGAPYQRRMCDCRRAMVVEITPDDPIAFYRGCCWAPGDTPAEAHAECERRIRDEWCEPEHPRRVDAVTGPYDRPGGGRLYESAEAHRFLAEWPTGEYFEWVDEGGEPPCFAAGTPVATPHGPVPIEHIAEGDRVLTLHRGREVAVPVIRVKARQVHRLLTLTLDGTTLRVTAEHPLRVGERWVAARELRVGDGLQTRDGVAFVRSVAVEEGAWTVHALRVGAPHSYLAGGVLAHNY